MNYSVFQSLVNPDALTYFLVNSGVFLAVAAAVFGMLGICFGRLVWGRDRAKLRNAEKVIENFKDEVASLKRRIAEGVSLPGRHFGPSLPLALSVQSTLKGPFYPVSRMFYTWGEPGWEPPHIRAQPQHASRAFTVWTHEEYDQPIAALFTASQAFTIWTDRLWSPPPARQAPTPPSQAFCLWTEPDVLLHPRALFSPNGAFTIWTEPDWIAPIPAHQPVGPSRAFTIWTEASFLPAKRILFSQSQAFSLWTEAGWAAEERSEPLPRGQAFTLWAPPMPPATPLVAEVPVPMAPSIEVAERQSLRSSVFARALTVARGALRRNRPSEEPVGEPIAPEAAAPAEPEAPPSIVPWYSPPEIVQRWHRLPLSQAFTLWTQPSWEPAARITGGHHPTSNGARLLPHAPAPPQVAREESRIAPAAMERGTGEEVAKMEIPFTTPGPASLASPVQEVSAKENPAPRPSEEVIEPTDKKEVAPAEAPSAVEAPPAAPALEPGPMEAVAMSAPASAVPPTLEIPTTAPVSSPIEPPLAPTPLWTAPEPPQAETGEPERRSVDAGHRSEEPAPGLPRAALIASAPAAPGSSRAPHSEIAPFPFLSVDPEALPDVHAPHWFHKDAAAEGLRQDARLGMVYDTMPENSDDLTAVSGISAERAHQLNRLGVYFFKQIALWGDSQMREFAVRLGMRERFIRDNWIEQARSLHFHRHRERI